MYGLFSAKNGQVPNWNFWKYLVSHTGEVVGAWGPWSDVEEIMPHIRQAVKVAQEDLNPDGPKPPSMPGAPSSGRPQRPAPAQPRPPPTPHDDL